MKSFATIAILLAASWHSVPAQAEEAGWIRHASISPDGQTIAFSYRGDIFTMPANGGETRQITSDAGNDNYPIWSPDGKSIAFGSGRLGGMDIYIVPAKGGTPRRLTTHSSRNVPLAFKDNSTILYSTAQEPTVADLQFPTVTQVFAVSADASRPTLFSEVPMEALSVAADGRVVYEDSKGYEDSWRKHHTSSVTHDIWMRGADGVHTRLTSFAGEDRNPVFSSDGQTIYYLSEENGCFNVYSRTADKEGKGKRLTNFSHEPVRSLSASADGTLCFSQDGDLYVMRQGGSPKKLAININADQMGKTDYQWYESGGAGFLTASADGKQLGIIVNNDVYVTDGEYKTTKRITCTPGLERNISFSADGRSVVYDSERDGQWGIYKSTIVNKDEKKMAYATDIKEERLSARDAVCQAPQYSPDGKHIAYLRGRTDLWVMDADGKHDHPVLEGQNYSYRDGDLDFSWSPDSRWLMVDYQGHRGWNIGDVAVVSVDGKEMHNVTNSGYNEGVGRWVMGGKAILFRSDRQGMRSHGSWGAQEDYFITFLDPEAYRKFCMNKEEKALWDDKLKNDTILANKLKKDTLLHFDFHNLEDRTMRLTTHSGSMGDAVLSKDGLKLYYIGNYQEGTVLWEVDLEKGSTSIKMKGMSWASFEVSRDEENAWFLQGGRIKKLKIGDGSSKDVEFEAQCSYNTLERYQTLFDHVWHQTREKLYDPKMNGADWNRLYKVYGKHLKHITTGEDFAELVGEMLGELNVSHTGCRYYPSGADAVASLGVLIDYSYEGDGLRIAEVLEGSPLWLQRVGKAGDIIKSIDGTPILAGKDYNHLLRNKSGRNVTLALPDTTLTIKPISMGHLNSLLYRRWVRRNEHLVDSLSGGQLAYVHIEAMNGASFHELFRQLLNEKNRQRKAAIIDVRHNGGGWLHQDVIDLLSGTYSGSYRPRLGQSVSDEPMYKWKKPSCMLVCEDCYSNAHGTPWLYKHLGVGKLIGAPVPGTMTAVWWENLPGGFVFGIPQVPWVAPDGTVLENTLLSPDIEVYNTPESLVSGRDMQIEAAVREMMKQQ